ncbi:MAG: dihydropteroate synthase [Ardenticatenaceae bacterium]|nr:dihydropteroate synthase [Ardenticatenaceae bacterium]
METILRSPSGKEVIIAPDRSTVMIGERINPSGGGRKKLTAALAAMDMELVKAEAIRQVAAGARVIDVNVQAADILGQESETLVAAIEAVASVVDVPISIDTNDRAAMPAALKVCPGRPLINSVTGEEESLRSVLPLAAEYGACLIGLTADDDGIPMTDPYKRLEIATKIVRRAEEYGLPPEDIIIDCVTLPIGAELTAAAVTMKAMRLVREELGVNLASGASNVSFGMPMRSLINTGFLFMIIAAGVNAPIVDPMKMRETVVAADLLVGRDAFAERYLAYYRELQAQPAPA